MLKGLVKSVVADHCPIVWYVDLNCFVSAKLVSRQARHARGKRGVPKGWRPTASQEADVLLFLEGHVPERFQTLGDMSSYMVAAAYAN